MEDMRETRRLGWPLIDVEVGLVVWEPSQLLYSKLPRAAHDVWGAGSKTTSTAWNVCNGSSDPSGPCCLGWSQRGMRRGVEKGRATAGSLPNEAWEAAEPQLYTYAVNVGRSQTRAPRRLPQRAKLPTNDCCRGNLLVGGGGDAGLSTGPRRRPRLITRPRVPGCAVDNTPPTAQTGRAAADVGRFRGTCISSPAYCSAGASQSCKLAR